MHVPVGNYLGNDAPYGMNAATSNTIRDYRDRNSAIEITKER